MYSSSLISFPLYLNWLPPTSLIGTMQVLNNQLVRKLLAQEIQHYDYG